MLSEEQERALDLVSQHCAERPLPQQVANGAPPVRARFRHLCQVQTLSWALQVLERDTTAAAHHQDGATEESEANRGSLEEKVLENSNQFYRWHSELEAARTLETEEKYQQYAKSLRGHLQALEGLQDKVSMARTKEQPCHMHQAC